MALYVVTEDSDEIKYDPVEPGEYRAYIDSLTIRESQAKNPQVLVDLTLLSDNPTYNNTSVRWFVTVTDAAMKVHRRWITNVMGVDAMPVGAVYQRIEDIRDVLLKMQFEPGTRPEERRYREFLVTVDQREWNGNVYNNVKNVRATPNNWKEPDRPSAPPPGNPQAGVSYDDDSELPYEESYRAGEEPF